MIARLFLDLTDYAAFRRMIWKPVYETIAKKFKVADWQFMNYGYAPQAHEAPLTLHPEDEVNRYSIQLYHYLVSILEVPGKEILEVGSGRGGGANYIKKYLKPEKITGLDIAYNAVKLANQKHSTVGLTFVQGNAEELYDDDASAIRIRCTDLFVGSVV
jgi:2-polyprenyl-3-methyl-5-hydroxy-6-metoxy-1,4-benzoquinol methylase